MFHNSNLTEYAGIINQAVDGLINNLRAAAKTGERLDMHRQLGRLTMQVIGAAAFGYDCDREQTVLEQFRLHFWDCACTSHHEVGLLLHTLHTAHAYLHIPIM